MIPNQTVSNTYLAKNCHAGIPGRKEPSLRVVEHYAWIGIYVMYAVFYRMPWASSKLLLALIKLDWYIVSLKHDQEFQILDMNCDKIG